jgi:hypothetical protein
MRIIYSSFVVVCCGLTFISCGQKDQPAEAVVFTKADSLTEFYLALQDSLHQTWNVMINDDNQKIKTMRNLLHELEVTHPGDAEKHNNFKERIDQLTRLRFTQKSMSNVDVVSEYDFATNSLITELVAEAESKPQYAYNATLQILVEQIQLADQRMGNYRQAYDSVVYTYNQFLEQNLSALSESEEKISLDKKPLFQMVAEE